MLNHPKMTAFDERLAALFREVDEALEERWGGILALHPARPPRGQTDNPLADGLFEVGPDFTAGYGSETGRGYLVTCRIRTLEKIAPDLQRMVMDEAAALIRERLPVFFPERTLTLVRDGPRYKITGDLSLGSMA
jgi:hypothetical protein